MTSVALVGFSKNSNQQAFNLPEGMELWTLNHGHLHGYPRIDRLFDMHPWELINDPHFYRKDYQQGHKDFLASPHEYPVVMQQEYPQAPSSVAYPIKAAMELAAVASLNFTSTFCYMFASAMMEGYSLIWVLGFDMAWGTEYAYQREDALRWIAFARGRGIEVYVPPESALYPKRRFLYGYERLPMVTREAIEVKVRAYERARDAALVELHKAQGIFIERQREHASRSRIEEARTAVIGWDRTVAMNEGAIQSMKELIATCDLLEFEPVNLDVAISNDGAGRSEK